MSLWLFHFEMRRTETMVGKTRCHSTTPYSHEVYFYALEAALMFLAIAVFSLIHLAMVANGAGSDMPGLFSTIKAALVRRQGRMPLAHLMQEQKLTRRSLTL
ncbi:hypothetical protein CCHL11_06633 [Colletotrichum chlorophyti]|uniref:Uncharacterized protein n=1 Tax=Colletotrichum chlorophyti TaxID=708187 RepID=A0A1Q8RXL2_9PEZI|nr:hypothetical protein CCHL11_06633 [Colletotrichum chlorophyti]